MSTPDTGTTREERLAAKLRENLRRRKVQARARPESESGTPAPQAPQATAALPKAPPES